MTDITPLFDDTEHLFDEPDPGEIRIASIDEVLATADKLPERTIAVPALGAGVGLRIKAFTQGQLQNIRERAKDRRTGDINADRLEILMFIEGVITPKFTMAQAEALRGVNASVINTVNTGIMELSGMLQQSSETAARRFRN